MEIIDSQETSKTEKELSDKVGEFSMQINSSFLAKQIVRTSAYIKGLLKGADYGIINSSGRDDGMNEYYSLSLDYYKKNKPGRRA